MREELQRTALLLDELSLQIIQSSKVAVFGIGGVGSYVVEALARVGIGSFILVDHDLVSISNINRQLIALHSTVGRPKVIVAKERILDVNPNASVEARQEFYLPGQDNSFLSGCSYIVDAIDTVASKLALVEAAEKQGCPFLAAWAPAINWILPASRSGTSTIPAFVPYAGSCAGSCGNEGFQS